MTVPSVERTAKNQAEPKQSSVPPPGCVAPDPVETEEEEVVWARSVEAITRLIARGLWVLAAARQEKGSVFKLGMLSISTGGLETSL